MVMYLNAGKLYLDHKDSSLVYQLYVNETINDGSWHHVYVGSTGSAIVMYIDGVSKTVTVGSGSNNGDWFNDITASKLDNVSIGAYTRTGTSAYFNGNIADVRYFNDAIVADAPILASKIQVDNSLTSLQAIHHWKLNSSTISTSGVGDDTGSSTIDLTPTSIVAGNFDYDAFSVDVYDNSTTTDGTFTVTQGKVEGKALTSVDFDGTDDHVDTSNTFLDGNTDFTIGCWIRHDGTQENSLGSIIDSRESGSDGCAISNHGGDNTIRLRINSNDITTPSNSITDNTWHHIVAGRDASNNTFIYIDGVLQVSGSSSATLDSNTGFHIAGAPYSTAAEFGGKIRDVKLFDYGLSAEQAASLYSGTYPQTPSHHYKLDEGSGTTASDTGTATASNGTLTNGPTYSNGTLDLDGTLTIAANGTLSMPRGDLRMSAAGVSNTFDINCTNVATQFIHNNGRFQTDAAGDFQLNANGAAFYKIITNCSSSGNLELQESMTIEKEVVNGSGDPIQLTGGQTYTFGTATQSADINEVLRASNGSGTVTVQGASSLYPVNISQYDDMARELNLNLANVNVTTALTHNRDKTITLTGDCEFDAVTVSSGDTLDLNGQRMECSGIFTIADGGDVDETNGGLLVLHNNLNILGAINGSNGLNVIVDGGTAHKWNLGQSGGGAHWADVVMTNGTVTHNGGVLGNPGGAHTRSIIIGNGTFTQSGGNTTLLDITVATGGTFVPSPTNTIVTCEGDFTTSGGLIGKSALKGMELIQLLH